MDTIECQLKYPTILFFGAPLSTSEADASLQRNAVLLFRPRGFAFGQNLQDRWRRAKANRLPLYFAPNGKFVFPTRPRRPFVFNEIGKFVSEKIFFLSCAFDQPPGATPVRVESSPQRHRDTKKALSADAPRVAVQGGPSEREPDQPPTVHNPNP